MKTLIFNGSPRKFGDTAQLIAKLTQSLQGEIMIINAYESGIAPCIDCRFCWENDACCIQDDMQNVYEYIKTCDNVVIASPLYFSELTGVLLSLLSRLQMFFYASYFRNTRLIKNNKKGAVILVGGGDGNIEKAYDTACSLLKHMNCTNIYDVVYSHNTNITPAIQDKDALIGINNISKFFNT